MSDKKQEMAGKTTCITGACQEDNAQELLVVLRHTQKLLGELGEEFAPEQNRIHGLESRLTSARFNLAVLGQFKRGKSTPLNALLGEDLLPAAVIPPTSSPHISVIWFQTHY